MNYYIQRYTPELMMVAGGLGFFLIISQLQPGGFLEPDKNPDTGFIRGSMIDQYVEISRKIDVQNKENWIKACITAGEDNRVKCDAKYVMQKENMRMQAANIPSGFEDFALGYLMSNSFNPGGRRR